MSKHAALLQKGVRRIESGKWKPDDQLPGIRVLAREYGCSPATMAQVIKELAAMGYVSRQPRRGIFVAPADQWGAARTARVGPKLVGILQAHTMSVFLPKFNSELRKFGYDAIVQHAEDDVDLALAHLRGMIQHGIDGLIWSPLSTRNHNRDNTRLAGAIVDSGIPAIAVDRYPADVEVTCVVSDNAQAATRLTRHFIEQGHSRIGLLRHKYGSTPEDRHRGHARALAEAGIAEDPALTLAVEHNLPPQELVRKVRKWLETTRPTAAWAIAADPLGQAMIAATSAAGLRVPDDLALATFDDVVAPWPVTCVVQPVEAIATRAVAMLHEQIIRPTSDVKRIVLRSELRLGVSSCIDISRVHAASN